MSIIEDKRKFLGIIQLKESQRTREFVRVTINIFGIYQLRTKDGNFLIYVNSNEIYINCDTRAFQQKERVKFTS